MSVGPVSGVGNGKGIPPPVAEYGGVNAEQKHLLQALRDGSGGEPADVKAAFMAFEAEKLELHPKLTDEQKAMRLERAEEFIDRHIGHLPVDDDVAQPPDDDDGVDPPPVDDPVADVAAAEGAVNPHAADAVPPFAPPGKPVDGPPKRRMVGRGLRAMHHAGMAGHGAAPAAAEFGQLNSAQWKVVGEFRRGDLSYEEAKAKFLDMQEQKLNLLVDAGRLTEEQRDARVEKFTLVAERLLAG